MLIDDLDKLPDSFKCGWRGLLLLYRSKDGESGNAQRKAVKLIVNGVDEWNDGIRHLRTLKDYGLIYSNHRIYASVNARNMLKAVHEFKRRQLEADYGGTAELREFYQDAQNRFFSCFMNPNSRAESYFLLDCDTPEDYSAAKEKASNRIIFDYETRNGRHLITHPFNPTDIPFQVNKDGLLLIG